MKTTILSVLFVVVFMGTAVAQSLTVDPSVLVVKSEGPVRMVVTEVCSGEHCWHQSYLQWLNLNGASRTVTKSVLIRELSVGVLVSNVESDWRKGLAPRFVLHVTPSQEGAFEPYTVNIQSKGVGNYEFSR